MYSLLYCVLIFHGLVSENIFIRENVNKKKKKTELKFLQIKQEITCGWNGYLGIWVFSPCMSSKLLWSAFFHSIVIGRSNGLTPQFYQSRFQGNCMVPLWHLQDAIMMYYTCTTSSFRVYCKKSPAKVSHVKSLMCFSYLIFCQFQSTQPRTL